ncbi:MAG: hypothetical protein HY735_05905 [Verrucomicrobia bacterium]|nr:hypothetical protein [Verrucomicrobiota bacterium]
MSKVFLQPSGSASRRLLRNDFKKELNLLGAPVSDPARCGSSVHSESCWIGLLGLFVASSICDFAAEPLPRTSLAVPSVRFTVLEKPCVVLRRGEIEAVIVDNRAEEDRREFRHDPDFPLTLVFNYSEHRYAEPWYFGVCREMAFIQIFRPQDQVRFSQSPSGGGTHNPAWDFQWFIPNPQTGRRYQLIMRALYRKLESNPLNSFESQDHLLGQIKRAQIFR